ncbi:MAG: helix-turn-helix transcriptional regulator [Gammaproteobacteria bacterium]
MLFIFNLGLYMLITYEKLSSNLNLLMAKARLNSNELARRTGIPASSIKKIRNNNNSNPTLATLTPIANHFSITISQLIGDVSLSECENMNDRIGDVYFNKYVSIPIVSWDDTINREDIVKNNPETVIAGHACSKNAFALYVKEDSGKVFTKGTLLIIEPAIIPGQNDHIITYKKDQPLPCIKTILIEDGEVFLRSMLVDSHVVPMSDEYKILGVIIEYRKALR